MWRRVRHCRGWRPRLARSAQGHEIKFIGDAGHRGWQCRRDCVAVAPLGGTSWCARRQVDSVRGWGRGQFGHTATAFARQDCASRRTGTTTHTHTQRAPRHTQPAHATHHHKHTVLFRNTITTIVREAGAGDRRPRKSSMSPEAGSGAARTGALPGGGSKGNNLLAGLAAADAAVAAAAAAAAAAATKSGRTRLRDPATTPAIGNA